ncbi:hypothetical protein VNO77_01916 [Canavalia gladiata]|uniref:Uncharacterized protein n=1 Tax=Canavalia gladiata TaxID=3824 RepID=A0AAN9MXA6_CANGL
MICRVFEFSLDVNVSLFEFSRSSVYVMSNLHSCNSYCKPNVNFMKGQGVICSIASYIYHSSERGMQVFHQCILFRGSVESILGKEILIHSVAPPRSILTTLTNHSGWICMILQVNVFDIETLTWSRLHPNIPSQSQPAKPFAFPHLLIELALLLALLSHWCQNILVIHLIWHFRLQQSTMSRVLLLENDNGISNRPSQGPRSQHSDSDSEALLFDYS